MDGVPQGPIRAQMTAAGWEALANGAPRAGVVRLVADPTDTEHRRNAVTGRCWRQALPVSKRMKVLGWDEDASRVVTMDDACLPIDPNPERQGDRRRGE